MNFTLHLTADCNLCCHYCYLTHDKSRMTEKTAFAAVDLCCRYNQDKHGFSLFGGEPLLLAPVIERLTEYAAQKDKLFTYKMTTNGTLLNEDFLRLADRRRISIAMSHDGLIQDAKRKTRDGKGTFELLQSKIDMLLAHQPMAIAMQTVTTDTVSDMAESVRWLYERGFTRINTAIDYRTDAGWDDESMDKLKEQYQLIAELAQQTFFSNRPLRYLNFTSKITTHLLSRPCIQCKLGVRQPSIAPDGSIYPCNQFLNLPEYRMGDVYGGIDREKQMEIFNMGRKPIKSCIGCAIEERCRHACSCLNFQLAGRMDTVAPVQCAHERILIGCADDLGEKLHKMDAKKLMHMCGADAFDGIE